MRDTPTQNRKCEPSVTQNVTSIGNENHLSMEEFLEGRFSGICIRPICSNQANLGKNIERNNNQKQNPGTKYLGEGEGGKIPLVARDAAPSSAFSVLG